MSLNQFSMVEELASLVKDNIPSKYLILAVEDSLVNFLHDDKSSNAVLELEPMTSYNRLLVHRLADIFGFAHQSVGEGEDRRLVLECCPETSMPSILVSDFLSQPGESESPMIFNVLRRKEVAPGPQNIDVVGGASLEERKAAYFAARERIFSGDASDSIKRPPKDPAVARRMITRALGQSSTDARDYGQTASPSPHMEKDPPSAKHPNGSKKQPHQKNSTLREGGSIVSNDDSLKKEHAGAAKRLFANALGVNRRDINLAKSSEPKKLTEI